MNIHCRYWWTSCFIYALYVISPCVRSNNRLSRIVFLFHLRLCRFATVEKCIILYVYTSLRTLFINISRAKFYSWSHLSLILSLIKIVKNSTICISVSAYSTWLDSLISTDWLTHFCDYDSIIQPDPLLPWNILYVKDFMENGTIKGSVYAHRAQLSKNSRRGGCKEDVIMDLINLR